MIRLLQGITGIMNPPGLEAFGLRQALITLADQWDKVPHPAATVLRLVLPPGDLELPLTVATVLWRVARGALENVRLHAEASHTSVELTQTGTNVSLAVRDNGKGFTMPYPLAGLAHYGHFGLLGMADQVESGHRTFI